MNILNTAALYIRVSTSKQEELSPDAQKRLLLVKIFDNNIQIGIKLDMNSNYLYIATLHSITDSKLNHGIKNGRLIKFDK